MESILHQIVEEEATFFISVAALSVVTITVIQAIVGLFTAIARERTKREIAAYIAEGSLSPEQGERLIRAAPAKQASA